MQRRQSDPIGPADRRGQGGYRIAPFRGTTPRLVSDAQRLVERPRLPGAGSSFPFLGVHFTPRMDGEVLGGPDAVWRWRGTATGGSPSACATQRRRPRSPAFWRLARRYPALRAGGRSSRDLSKRLLVRELQRYVPSLKRRRRRARGRAARARSCSAGTASSKTTSSSAASPHMLHVLDAPSPAATASLAIGRLVADEAAELLS